MSNYIWHGNNIRAWTKGVPVESEAIDQTQIVASLPFVRGVALMPDVHRGIGSNVGTVVATDKAIVPSMVGVDIGCGMVAIRTSLSANDLPDNLHTIRAEIERAVPHGRTRNGGNGDRGAWATLPASVSSAWKNTLDKRFENIIDKHPKIGTGNSFNHLCSLGTGNHFIELCLDTEDRLWIMLHSGSRGVGNRIGQYFINAAKEEMQRYHIGLADKDLSYLVEDTVVFNDYIEAMHWAQDFAYLNRQLMLERTLAALRKHLPPFTTDKTAINCHHNYATKEVHGGSETWITRKGAVHAGLDELGIIPGSMGARSFIVRGLGNEDSFCSCSHGAGRVMSRTQAKKLVSVEEHEAALASVECNKSEDTLDETPSAYKNIDDVMNAQKDLVEIVHTLKQIVCVKG